MTESVAAALQALSDVMIPFALAVFLAIALAPVVDGLSHHAIFTDGVWLFDHILEIVG